MAVLVTKVAAVVAVGYLALPVCSARSLSMFVCGAS